MASSAVSSEYACLCRHYTGLSPSRPWLAPLLSARRCSNDDGMQGTKQDCSSSYLPSNWTYRYTRSPPLPYIWKTPTKAMVRNGAVIISSSSSGFRADASLQNPGLAHKCKGFRIRLKPEWNSDPFLFGTRGNDVGNRAEVSGDEREATSASLCKARSCYPVLTFL